MIPALALAVPLLRSAGRKYAARSQPRLVTRAQSLAPLSILAQAAPELPAQEPQSRASKADHNRAALESAAHPALRPVGQRFPAAPAAASSATVDPEVQSIETRLQRIEQDPRARQQFYAEVDSLIRRVRSGRPIPPSLRLDDQLPLPPDRVTLVSARFSSPGPSSSQALEDLSPSSSAGEFTPQLHAPPSGSGSPNPPEAHGPSLQQPLSPRLLSPQNRPLDPAAVSRVIYWAQANGCPVQLALAVAWQESAMNLHPARGSSGEIGMMQILPERARLEGVDPTSLDDPETNLWLGTKLLARYYSEEGSVERAAMKYVAGPGVFEKHYAPGVRDYISWYSASVDNYARYFGQYLNF